MRMIYITAEISQKKEGRETGERKKRRKGSWETRGAGNSHLQMRSPFSLGSMAV